MNRLLIKLLIAIALLALALSIFALATPNEVVVVVEKEATIESTDSHLVAPSSASPLPATYRLQPPATYHWVESEAYRRWKNSVKTEDKYLPSHFGLGGSLSSSGHWEK